MPARHSKTDPSRKIIGVYLIFGITWILFSDQLLGLLVQDPDTLTRLQTFKGWSFVLLTALLLFLLIRRYRHRELRQINELHERDARLALAHEVTGTGVWEWDLQSSKVIWSKEVEALYGLAAGSFDGSYEAWLDLVCEEDRQRVIAAVEAWFSQPGPINLEYCIRHPDGGIRWLLSYGNTIDDEQGKPHRLLGINMDITERKQTEERLQRSEKVFQRSRDAIFITDSNANIIAINPAFSEITGFSESDIIGKQPNALKSDHHSESFYRHIWASIDKYDGWSGEIWNRRKGGNIYPAWLSVSTIRDGANRVINYIGILSDLSQIKRSEAEIEHLSTHDPLTDLPNGRLLGSRLAHAITQAGRHKSGLAVLMLDIDRFKDINESLGLSAGDTLIMEIARRVNAVLWEGDTVARIGGDELLVLIEDVRSPQHAVKVAEKIRSIQNKPFRIGEHELFITMSLGISLYPENGDTPELLIRNADAAVYRAKEEGRNRIAFYSESLSRAAAERLSLEAELRYALEQGQFELHYQPQINLSSNMLSGVEALVRWRHPSRGLIPPDNFIPLAESTGLIDAIGKWVLDEGCRQMREWNDSGIAIPRISVNLSAKQLGHEDLVTAVKTTLEKYRLDPKSIELELTETAIMQDPEKAAETLQAMAELGIEMAVDDFGTGYSSLSYLQRLKMHRLKIDRAFVHDIPTNKNNAAICRAVIAMAHSLGMETVAEGVEQTTQAQFLELESCTIAQGWLYAKAMPAAELVAWFGQRKT